MIAESRGSIRGVRPVTVLILVISLMAACGSTASTSDVTAAAGRGGAGADEGFDEFAPVAEAQDSEASVTGGGGGLESASQPGGGGSAGEEAGAPGAGGEEAGAPGAAGGDAGPDGPLPAAPESGVTEDEVVFGSIYPVSSGFSQVFDAKELARLMERLTQRQNEMGGINGRKLRFVWYDDGFDPAKGAEVMKKLVEEDRVLSVVGTVSTFTTENTADYLKANNVTHIAPEGYQEQAYTYDNFYPVTNYFDVQGDRMGRYVTCELGFKNVGVFAVGNYRPSKEGGDAIERAVTECGGTVVDRENVNFAETNYTPFVLRMRSANPDVVLSAMDPLDDAVLLQTMQSQNYRPPQGMMFVSAFSAFKSIAQGAGSFADGFWSVSEFDATIGSGNKRLQDYLAFAESIGIDGSDRFPLEVWSGFEIMVEAATKAGANLNRTTFKAQLDQLDIDLGFACEPFSFRPGPKKANPCLRVIQWDADDAQWNTVVPFERVS